jgi:histone deacetylase 6
MKKLKSRHATADELSLAHEAEHIQMIRETAEQTSELQKIGKQFDSVFLHPKTYECATMAAGSVLEVVDEVLSGRSRSGCCIIRPPGHHAESDEPHGFCIFNNVAVAAAYALRSHGLRRILIVDWDIHHGNGTQHIFEDNPNVLYLSLHRYDHASFFPKSVDADFGVVGDGAGEGYNVNIPWNKKGMGDSEYATAFQNVVLPIAYEFDPELVFVSAGFDAAIGDPLGGCKVTPEAYGVFTHWLSALANGRVILCLEGGYNVNSIAYSMTMCSKALLGDPMPALQISPRTSTAQASCWETLRNVIGVQKKYWKSLRFDKKLPAFARTPIDDLDVKFSVQMTLDAPTDADNCRSQADSSAAGTPSASAGPSTSRSSGVAGSKQTLTDFLSENAEVSPTIFVTNGIYRD